MKKLALILFAAVGIGAVFSGCADESKSPLMEMKGDASFGIFINLYSQDDETIINKMTISGRNGKCDIKNLGAGGELNFFLVSTPLLKYGEKLTYNAARTVTFEAKDCPPKNGKYDIELNTNFGTYYYEMTPES